MNALDIISFLIAAMLLTLAPGPDVLYLLTKSLASGAKSGVALAAGLSNGVISHTLWVMIGVAAFIQHSPTAFAAMKYAGAAYLLYLAWKSFREKPEPFHLGQADSTVKVGALYRRGLIMNALNPKVLLFFLAFLPQFIHEGEALSPSLQIGVLGLIFSIQAFCIFSLIAVCAGKVRDKLLSKANLPRTLNLIQTGVLAFMAVGLLFL